MDSFVSTVAVVAVAPATVVSPAVTDLRSAPETPVSGWEAEATRIQSKNESAGFLPVRPARPFLDFERPEFEDAPYPEEPVGSLDDRLAAMPQERCNIKEAVSEFSAREGRKPASPEEVREIARKAGIRELSYFGLYRDFEHEGYLTVIKNGRPTL